MCHTSKADRLAHAMSKSQRRQIERYVIKICPMLSTFHAQKQSCTCTCALTAGPNSAEDLPAKMLPVFTVLMLALQSPTVM